MIKNIETKKVSNLENEVSYVENQICSKIICSDEYKSLTIFSFDKDQEIKTHTTTGDALVTVLDGRALIVIDKVSYELNKGESIVMPANIPHSVYAIEQMKMQLFVAY